MKGLERHGAGVGLPPNGEGLAIFREKTSVAHTDQEPFAPWTMSLLEWEGLPVSPGVAQGSAVVTLGEGRVGWMQAGSILVCSSMAPALIELLPQCRGLVCERGGMLNPTATTAREYGIPVVVSAGRVTPSIQDGDTVRIDGSRGTVTVLLRGV